MQTWFDAQLDQKIMDGIYNVQYILTFVQLLSQIQKGPLSQGTQSYPGRQQNVHVPRDKFPREKRPLAPTYHQQVDFSLKKKRMIIFVTFTAGF